MDIRHKFKLEEHGIIDDPNNPQKVKPSNWDDNHELVEILLDDITTPYKNNAGNVTDLLKAYNLFWSAGIISGGAITDNLDGTVNIASGEAMMRSGTDENSPLFNITFSAKNNISLVDENSNYICTVYVASGDYCEVQNVGTDVSDFNCRTSCIMWLVSRVGTEVHKIDARFQNMDSNVKHRRTLLECEPYRHASVLGGTKLGNPSGLYINLTAGKFYFGLSSFTHETFDTSIAGTDKYNKFLYYRTNGLGGWIYTDNVKTIDNLYYDSNGTLTLLGNKKYKVDYVYLIFDNVSPHLVVIYGNTSYNTVADADSSLAPSEIPSLISNGGILVGRIIIEGNAGFIKIDNAFEQSLSLAGTTSHNHLSGLQGGMLDQYYHLTSLEYTGTGTGVFVRRDSPTLTTLVTLSGDLVMRKDSATGIKIDTLTPTFGWRDITSGIDIKGIGASDPTWDVYRTNGSNTVSAFSFPNNNVLREVFATFHMPHDYVLGSDLYVHVHWSQKVVDTGGTAGVPGIAEWNFDISYANGHGTPGGVADPFNAPILSTVLQQASTTQYGHMIAEVMCTSAVGDASHIDRSRINIDGLLIVRLWRNNLNVSDTLNQVPFIHFLDLHYQSTNLATKNKAPNFYG